MMTYDHKLIKIGMLVEIQVEKTQDTLKVGHVVEVLSHSNSQKGVRVKLKDGTIGRVTYIPSKDEIKKEQFKYMNSILYERQVLYSFWDNVNRRYFTTNYRSKVSSFIFSDKDEAEAFMKSKFQEPHNFTVNPINRKKLIVENFEVLGVEFFILDKTTGISFKDLKEKEEEFKNLLKTSYKKR